MWKTRFVLIADELNNNAIEYGSRSNEYNKLRLKIKAT
jgi:two-component sensor histidine kinase